MLFASATGRRPSVDVLHPDVAIHIHIQRNEVIVSLDSSGASLHQRGYRTATNIAPINEVLAAGILLMSGWKGQSDFSTLCVEWHFSYRGCNDCL